MNTSFFSHLHTFLRQARLTRHHATHKAEDVPRGTHKEYPRMETILLPKPKLEPVTLQRTLETRRSGFGGNPDTPTSLAELGTLLGLALQVRDGGKHRNYPSGGALYPV